MTYPSNSTPESKHLQGIQSWYEPALKLLDDLFESAKMNLRKRNYNEANAAVNRYQFREHMQRQFRIHMALAMDIEKSLQKAGKIEARGAGFVKPKTDGGQS